MLKTQIKKQECLEIIKKLSERLKNLNILVSNTKFAFGTIGTLNKQDFNRAIIEYQNILLELKKKIECLKPTPTELEEEFNKIVKETNDISKECL